MIRLYLDLCCFNRPFDDQSQTRVRLETEAKLALQEHVRSEAAQRLSRAAVGPSGRGPGYCGGMV